MMFIIDIAFSLELIALIFGAALLIYAMKHTDLGTALPKFIAYLVMILAVLSMLCTGYYTVKYWIGGYFEQPAPISRMMMKSCMMKKCRMENCMKCGMMNSNNTQKCKMMENMKNGMKQNMPMNNKMMNNPSQMTSSQGISSEDNEHAVHHPQ